MKGGEPKGSSIPSKEVSSVSRLVVSASLVVLLRKCAVCMSHVVWVGIQSIVAVSDSNQGCGGLVKYCKWWVKADQNKRKVRSWFSSAPLRLCDRLLRLTGNHFLKRDVVSRIAPMV